MKEVKRWRALFALPIALSIGNTAYAASCDVKITNEWNSGYGISVTILNDTTSAINGWSTSWAFTSATVSQLWNGDLAGTNPYTVTNVGHNQSIAPNETVQFGFNAKKNQLNIPAELPVLGGICSSVNSNQAPVAIASVTPATGTIPFDVTFNASASTDPDNDTLTYIWDFGNGDTAITAIATRSFTTAGNYTATLTVSDGALDSPTKTFTVTANDTPPTDDIAYSLDPMASTVYFVSTKKTHVIESHTFTNISGNVSDLGSAKLVIDLNSVDTNNLTRDERMKNMLFETAVFSEATVTVALDPTTYANQSIGTTQTQSLNATVDLHGVSTLLSVEVLVSKLTDSTLLVQNVAPVLLNTTDYNLNAGVEALRAVANLSVISYAVPVNFNLVFNKTANLP